MTQTPRPSNDQGDLLADDEPKSNSREDTGFTRPGGDRPEGVDDRPPAKKSFGRRSPGPDPVPVNVCSNAIQILDARKFVAWIHDQDIEIHEDVTVGHVLVALSGLGTEALGFLCRGCRQAGRAPEPWRMKEAAMKKDVALLRGSEPKKSDARARS